VRSGLVERLQRTPPGYGYPLGRVLAIYSALMVCALLIALDQTIVATALPHIASDLGGLSEYSWVFTAYLLCQTVTVPLYGKLGDNYGHRRFVLVGLVIFVAGSALCGLATSMAELAVFRGVQGVGAGGLWSLALAVVGQIVPPRDRARYHGLFSATFGAGSILGPIAGGIIVDNTSWRWIFLVNVPIGVLAFVAISSLLPQGTRRQSHSIDYSGAALLAAGTGLVLLGLVWGGQTYPWSSPEVIGAIAVGLAVLAVFALHERRARETILPFATLRQPIVAAGAACTGMTSMCTIGTIAFVPLFVQGVIGTSATHSGLVLMPLLLSTVVASIASGQWVSRSGRYRPNAILGPIVLGAGMVLMWRMDSSTTTAEAARNMIVVGAGVGMMMNVFLVAAQNAVPLRLMGSTTASLQFARGIGTTFGATIFGVIVNQGLPEEARGATQLHRLSGHARDQLAAALHPAFLLGACVCALMLVIVLVCIDARPLRRSLDEVVSEESVDAGLGAPVLEGDGR
jgi:EmrB/QacA subfamily drug resistance transporter